LTCVGHSAGAGESPFERDSGDSRSERGVVGLDWFLIVPLFLGLVLVLVALPQWPERQSGARGAAAEAARAAVLVESPSEVEGVARSVAAEVLTNYGISPDQYSVSVDGTVERGTRIEVTVSILLPVIAVPFGPDIASRSYQAKASEDVEAYREITP
jgi:hypothetical protein